MDGHCLSPYTCKRCIVSKQFDELNFDCLAESIKKVKISPIKILHYMVSNSASHHDEAWTNLFTYRLPFIDSSGYTQLDGDLSSWWDLLIRE